MRTGTDLMGAARRVAASLMRVFNATLMRPNTSSIIGESRDLGRLDGYRGRSRISYAGCGGSEIVLGGTMTDRELDALVAEKVMGLRLWDPALSFVVPCWIEQKGGAPTLSEIGAGISLPHYTTDISDAWKVFERYKHPQVKYDDSTCDFIASMDWPSGKYERGDTGPMAICLAALAHHGINVTPGLEDA